MLSEVWAVSGGTMIKDRRRNDRRKMSRKVQLRSVDELLLSHGTEGEELGD